MKNPFIKDQNTPKNRQPQAFIEAARDFEKSRIQDVISRESMWKKIAGVAILLTILSTASALVAVLKRVEPEPTIIQVDKSSGITSVLRSVKDTQDKYDVVINKYWLSQYVLARESYDWYTISTQFEKVKLMSTNETGTGYALKAQAPNSPLEVLKDKGKIQVKILGISFVNELAQVRYTTEKLDATGVNSDNSPMQHWIATISFAFDAGVMTEAQRMINPLGFKVYSYKTDAEVTKQ